MQKAVFALLAGALSIVALEPTQAAVMYNTTGGTYMQDFNSLPNTPTDTSLGNSPTGWQNDNAAPGAGNFSILGWYLFHPATPTEGGFDSHQRMRIGAGGANTGAFMSYGAAASTERAMGSLISSTTVGTVPGQQYIGLRLTNNTPDILTEFTLSYDGEQWRDGGAAVPASKTLLVEYSTTATAVNDTPAYTAAPSSLNFTTPVFANTGAGAAVNGNTAGKTSIGPVSVTGFVWNPGTDLWIRWKDPRNSGNNHAVGVDNVSFTATVPEPASAMVLMGFGALALRRRSR